MAATERPLSAIVGDIVGNLQHIVRSEIRLAKAETADELARLRQAAMWLGAGATAGLLGAVFVLLAVTYLLALWLPMWAAALVTGLVVLAVAAACVTAGRSVVKAPPLPRTKRALKETLTWTRP